MADSDQDGRDADGQQPQARRVPLTENPLFRSLSMSAANIPEPPDTGRTRNRSRSAAHRDGVSLPLAHQREESPGQTAAVPDPVVVQAARDIEAGLVDTDMHGTPGMDHEKREALLEAERRR